jgi:hypothetical protein
MIDRTLFDWAPLSIAIVVGSFFADYALTHLGARAAEGVRDRWGVEGSYEMNPTWERQIDSGQWLSSRVVLVPAFLILALGTLRFLATVFDFYADPAWFGLAVGTMLLVQAPILMLHAANLQTFRLLRDPTAVEGAIRYRRWLVYRQSMVHLAGFAVLWLLLWLPSQQAFFLGGALSCALWARRMGQLGAAARQSQQTVYDSVTETRR